MAARAEQSKFVENSLHTTCRYVMDT